MDIKLVLVTLLKILISTPSVFIMQKVPGTSGAALLGGDFTNSNRNSSNMTKDYYDYDLMGSQELDGKNNPDLSSKVKSGSEEIPDPSPLVLPGYNLPETIFNHGKPFYVEKDPLTGKIDFNHKSPSLKLDEDQYDYVDDEPSDNIYDKSNIDRKDGILSSHRPTDVNQLTPNFHDFLNLPVKYNSAKYVYPLISSSYASTKVQGSVNKFHNHKDYNSKTTKKPIVSPTYYSTHHYFNPTRTTTKPTTTTTTTTTEKPTTVKQFAELYSTIKSPNLMNTEMGHHSFNEEFSDYYDEMPSATKKPLRSEIYLTTENVDKIHLTSKAPITSTKKTMSLFEQLFGEYDEAATTVGTTKSTPKPLFTNLPSSKPSKNKYQSEMKTEKPSYTSTTNSVVTHYTDANAESNVLTGTSMGLEPDYEYEDEYSNGKYEDNIAVQNRPMETIDDELTIEPLNINNTDNIPSSTTEYENKISENKIMEQKNITNYYNKYEYPRKEATTVSTTVLPTKSITTTTTTVVTTTTPGTIRVTSLPLGDNHVTTSNYEPINRDPIIVATQNLREKLNSEKVVPRPFEKPTLPLKPPSTSNIHIAPNQDMVSFVVGNHQNVDDDTPLKESPYDSNPFRPLYDQHETYKDKDSVSYTIQTEPQDSFQLSPPPPSAQLYPEAVGSAVTIQPLKNSEASLAIGVPINSLQQIPGQVVDEELEINNPIGFPQSSGSKIVFPNDKESEFTDLIPPPRQQPSLPNRDVLNLNSEPMYHQLPSDLTPPKQQATSPPPPRSDRPMRPPWDPRPGHFYSGKPEYNRPPRPPPDVAFKRIDNLPNILPQFRPGMNKHSGPPPAYYDKRLVRQPLLERPSNRPIGFFEKLLPPPPPQFHAHDNLQALRKNLLPPRQSLDDSPIAEDRIINEGLRRPIQSQDPFGFYNTPPQVKIANRRNGDDDIEVETLQMIQAKNDKKENGPTTVTQVVNIPAENNFDDNTEKTIYKVYPVNTPPIKLDVAENNKKESVVVGTRAELPLPPSKINNDFLYDQNPLFDPKDRNDAPILKPHHRPPSFPVRSDFPYPLERPDTSLNHPAVPEIPSNNGIDLEESDYFSSNQWNNLEPRIVTGQKLHNTNQISVTLKSYTEKPIAVAYRPTEPNLNADRYSMPNYGSPVIPEIRPGTVESSQTGNKEFTVSAIMHTHPQLGAAFGTIHKEPITYEEKANHKPNNHKSDSDIPSFPKLDFEAPFQASVSIDSSRDKGWSVIRDKNKTTTESPDVTTMPYATTSEFDIENFKPQLEGGFRPIYTFPENNKKLLDLKVSEREE